MNEINILEELNTVAIALKDDFVNLIPKILVALLVLAIGYVMARVIKFAITKLMDRLNVLVSQKFQSLNIKESTKLVAGASYWIVLLSTLLLITDILDITAITALMEAVIKYSPNIIGAILIIFIATVVGRILSNFISSVSPRFGFDYGLALGRIAQYLILFTAFIIAFDQIGIEVTFLISLIDIVLAALLFGAALAFGLGAQTSFSNILASFYVRKIYREGDHIMIDNIEGVIVKIDNTVVILDTEGGRIIVPARDFSQKKSLIMSKK